MVKGIFIASLAILVGVTHLPTTRADHVNWSSDVETGLRSARQSGRLVLMKFTADWCGYCKKMERETFTRPAVASLVNEQFVPILVDADKHQDLVQHLKIKGLPAILVVSPEMAILTRISGYQTEAKLMPQLQAVLSQHRSSPAGQAPVVGATVSNSMPARPVSQTAQASTGHGTSQQVAATAFVRPAFGGLCLPAVNETRSLVSGRPEFSLEYRGRTLFFSSLEYKQKFQASPEKFWPAYDGTCPVTFAETGRAVEGKLEFAAVFRNQLWVTDNAEAMQKFVKQPASYVDRMTQQ